jgi:CubicO group peptidase (beta-lactamase class C family)
MRNLLPILCFFYSIHFATAQEFAAVADKLLQEEVDKGSLMGVSAGFSIAGDVKWLGAAGDVDSEHAIKFNVSTLNRIASISKPITALAVMQLYEQGKIELDVPIQTYLTDFPQKKEGDITVRQLLNHSSGMDDYKNRKEMENQIHYGNLREAMKVFEHRDLVSVPGQEFHYTTYGYVVLGRIIEVVSGQLYEDYIQKKILDPLEMKHTGVEVVGEGYTNKSGLFHRDAKGKLEEADPTDLSDRIPGGGLYSTAGDMLLFGDAILQHTLISDNTTKIMFTDQGIKNEGNGYGLGWYLYGENPNYGPVYGHNGAQTGASTFLMLLPQQETAIVVLSNTSGAMQEVSNCMIKLFDVAAMAKS